MSPVPRGRARATLSAELHLVEKSSVMVASRPGALGPDRLVPIQPVQHQPPALAAWRCGRHEGSNGLCDSQIAATKPAGPAPLDASGLKMVTRVVAKGRPSLTHPTPTVCRIRRIDQPPQPRGSRIDRRVDRVSHHITSDSRLPTQARRWIWAS